MPKIRDLGISAISFARAAPQGAVIPGYRMCDATSNCSVVPCDPSPPQCHPSPPPCNPSPPPCQASNKPPHDPQRCPDPSKQPDPKGAQKAGALPHAAILQLKQQLKQRTGRPFHA